MNGPQLGRGPELRDWLQGLERGGESVREAPERSQTELLVRWTGSTEAEER